MSKRDNNFSWQDGISIKDYFTSVLEQLCKANDQRFEDLEGKIMAIFEAQKIAFEKSETKLNTRLEAMNEFRQAMGDQAKEFMTKDFYEARHDLIQKQVDDLRLTGAELKGKASQTSVMIAYALSFIGLLMGIIDFIARR